MKTILTAKALTLAILAVTVAFIAGCSSTGPLAVKEAGYPADKVDARALFVENCATCHGKNGRALTFHGRLVGAQNLTDAKWQVETTDEEIINAIKTGPKVMPAFGKKLSSSEIQAMTKYVRSLAQGS